MRLAKGVVAGQYGAHEKPYGEKKGNPSCESSDP
jgi:hypothetical protein